MVFFIGNGVPCQACPQFVITRRTILVGIQSLLVWSYGPITFSQASLISKVGWLAMAVAVGRHYVFS